MLIYISKRLISLFLTFFLAHVAFGQGISGSFTIGDEDADFPSIEAFLSHIDTVYLTGDVVGNILPGTYYGRYEIPQLTYSTISTLTLQSSTLDSSDVIITDLGVPIIGGDRPIFNVLSENVVIKSLSIQLSGESDKPGISIYKTNCKVSNCSFSGIGIFVEVHLSNNSSSAVISDNFFFGGWKQCNILGHGQNIRIERNTFQNTLMGLPISYNCPSIVIDGIKNVIIRENYFLINSPDKTISITGVNGSIDISRNELIIHNSYSNIIELSMGSFFSPNNRIITNNLIKITSDANTTYNPNRYVIDMPMTTDNSSSEYFIFNNTIHCEKHNGLSNIGPNKNLYNNVIIMNGFYKAFSGNLEYEGNSNVFYNSSSDKIFKRVYGTSVSELSLTDIQANSDNESNSLFALPSFISQSNLRADQSLILNNAGVFFPEVVTDIDGDIRDTLSPDIGADEFTPNLDSIRDIGIDLSIGNVQSSCQIPDTFWVGIINFGVDTIYSVKSNLSFLNLDENTIDHAIILAPGDTTLINLGTLNINGSGSYIFNLAVTSPNNLADHNSLNNLLSVPVSFENEAVIKMISTGCEPYQRKLILMNHLFDNIEWSTGETTKEISITSPGEYAVQVYFEEGNCTLSKTELFQF